MKLNIRALAVAFGLVWGFGLLILTWWIMLFEGATKEKTIIGKVYRGYEISPRGSLIGLVWGFVDAFVGALAFGWLYNCIVERSNPIQRLRSMF